MIPSSRRFMSSHFPLSAPEGKARNKRTRSRAGSYTFLHPTLPPPPSRAQNESGRARGSPPASQLYRPLAGRRQRPPPHPARRAQRPHRGLQGHFPNHFSAGPAAPEALVGDASGKARRPATPCPSLATATLGWRGPRRRPPRSLRRPRSPRRGPQRGSGAPFGLGGRRDPGRGSTGGPCLHHQVPCFRPSPRVPPSPRRPSLCLPACRAGPTAPGSGPWRSARPLPGTGRPGRGDSRGRRGPRAAHSPRAAGRRAKPESGFGGAGRGRVHPSPHGSRAGWWLSGEWRTASPCTAPGGAARGAGPPCELLLPPLLLPPPSPPLQLDWTLRSGVGMGAHNRPSPRALRSPRPGPAPASAPAAGPGTPPRVSGRGRRLAGAGRPRPQPPAPPPAGAGGDPSVAPGWPPPSVGWAE